MMLVIINAFKSITRSKGRNILIGIIVLTIAVSSSIALAIRSAADAAKESGLAAQTIAGTISIDRQCAKRKTGVFGWRKWRWIWRNGNGRFLNHRIFK